MSEHPTKEELDIKKIEDVFRGQPFSVPSETTIQHILKYAGKAVTKPTPSFFWVFKQARAFGLAMSVVVITGLGIFYYFNHVEDLPEQAELEKKEDNIKVGSSSSFDQENDGQEEEMSPTEKFNWANQLKEKGECERAVRLYDSIYSNQDKPFKPLDTLLFNWASCLEKLGKKSEAKNYLLELKKINPTYPGLGTFIQRLK